MKKYDCSKLLDYQHEQKRMCKIYEAKMCDDCPLMYYDDCMSLDAVGEHEIAVVQKWSDANPKKTREEAFFDLIKGTIFEKAFEPIYEKDGLLRKTRENGAKCIGIRSLLELGSDWWEETYD